MCCLCSNYVVILFGPKLHRVVLCRGIKPAARRICALNCIWDSISSRQSFCIDVTKSKIICIQHEFHNYGKYRHKNLPLKHDYIFPYMLLKFRKNY